MASHIDTVKTAMFDIFQGYINDKSLVDSVVVGNPQGLDGDVLITVDCTKGVPYPDEEGEDFWDDMANNKILSDGGLRYVRISKTLVAFYAK